MQIHEIVKLAKQPVQLAKQPVQLAEHPVEVDEHPVDVDDNKRSKSKKAKSKAKSQPSEQQWITLKNGKHVLIDPEDGSIEAGNMGVAKQGDTIHPNGGSFNPRFSQQTVQANRKSRESKRKNGFHSVKPVPKQDKPEQKKDEPNQEEANPTSSEQATQLQQQAKKGGVQGFEQLKRKSRQIAQAKATQERNRKLQESSGAKAEAGENGSNSRPNTQQHKQSTEQEKREIDPRAQGTTGEAEQANAQHPQKPEQSTTQPEQNVLEQSNTQQSNPQNSEGQQEPTDEEWEQIQRALHPERYNQPQGSEQPNQQGSQNPEQQGSEENAEQQTPEQNQQPSNQSQEQPAQNGKRVVPKQAKTTSKLDPKRRKQVRKADKELRQTIDSHNDGRVMDMISDIGRNNMCISVIGDDGSQMFAIPDNPNAASQKFLIVKKGKDGQILSEKGQKLMDSQDMMRMLRDNKAGFSTRDLSAEFPQFNPQDREKAQNGQTVNAGMSDEQWNRLKKQNDLDDDDRDILNKLNPQQQQKYLATKRILKNGFTVPKTKKEQRQQLKENVRQKKEELRSAKAALHGTRVSKKGSLSDFKRAVNGSTANIGGQTFTRVDGKWVNDKTGKSVTEKDLANLAKTVRRQISFDPNDVASKKMEKADTRYKAQRALRTATKGTMMIVGNKIYRKDKDGNWSGNNNQTLTEFQLAKYIIKSKNAGVRAEIYQRKPFTPGSGYKQRMNGGNQGAQKKVGKQSATQQMLPPNSPIPGYTPPTPDSQKKKTKTKAK